jgi:hypothetical protein
MTEMIKDFINKMTVKDFDAYKGDELNALQIKSSYDNVCDDVTIKLNTDVLGIIGEFVGLDILKKNANDTKIQRFGFKIWNEIIKKLMCILLNILLTLTINKITINKIANYKQE